MPRSLGCEKPRNQGGSSSCQTSWPLRPFSPSSGCWHVRGPLRGSPQPALPEFLVYEGPRHSRLPELKPCLNRGQASSGNTEPCFQASGVPGCRGSLVRVPGWEQGQAHLPSPKPPRSSLMGHRQYTPFSPSLQGPCSGPTAESQLTATSACRVDTDERSGQYLCIFLSDPKHQTSVDVRGELCGPQSVGRGRLVHLWVERSPHTEGRLALPGSGAQVWPCSSLDQGPRRSRP